jgi:hypothetical protein
LRKNPQTRPSIEEVLNFQSLRSKARYLKIELMSENYNNLIPPRPLTSKSLSKYNKGIPKKKEPSTLSLKHSLSLIYDSSLINNSSFSLRQPDVQSTKHTTAIKTFKKSTFSPTLPLTRTSTDF